jgi:hypothetical protein
MERGTNAIEIENVLATGEIVPAHSGRLAKAKVLRFPQVHKSVEYPSKRVEVCYVKEGDATIVVTVYVFYGTWEQI